MKRRTKAGLLGLAAVVTVGAAYFALNSALIRTLDPGGYCVTGFSSLVDCNYHRRSQTISQGTPDPAFAAFASDKPRRFQPTYTDVTSWGVVDCPQNAVARRLLCATPSAAAPIEVVSDLDTGLPLPRPWLLRTARESRFIKSIHVETPLDLTSTLRFYRAELGKRGWTEDDGADVAPDRAVVTFTTRDGPAQLRLTHQDHRTVADLSLRKPVADADDGILPKPGQVRLRLVNDTDDESVMTINERAINVAGKTGGKLTDNPETSQAAAGIQEIDLPPGKYQVVLKSAGGEAQNRAFEVAAGETWGLVVGKAGALLPVQLY